jgi:hypothetical protein
MEQRLALRAETRKAPISMARASARQAIDPAVAAVFDVEIADLRGPTRSSPQAAFARQVAMYLAHVICGLSLTEIGALFQRTAPPSRMRAAWSRTGATTPRSTRRSSISSERSRP